MYLKNTIQALIRALTSKLDIHDKPETLPFDRRMCREDNHLSLKYASVINYFPSYCQQSVGIHSSPALFHRIYIKIKVIITQHILYISTKCTNVTVIDVVKLRLPSADQRDAQRDGLLKSVSPFFVNLVLIL